LHRGGAALAADDIVGELSGVVLQDELKVRESQQERNGGGTTLAACSPRKGSSCGTVVLRWAEGSAGDPRSCLAA
jgi:hypothetical protein